jgi:hypothetical protein
MFETWVGRGLNGTADSWAAQGETGHNAKPKRGLVRRYGTAAISTSSDTWQKPITFAFVAVRYSAAVDGRGNGTRRIAARGLKRRESQKDAAVLLDSIDRCY